MHSGFWHRIQDYLLPCPLKWLTGIDCPGCGFQRSFLALLQGDIAKSFELYPATVPFLLLFATAVLHKWFGVDRKGIFLKSLIFFTGSVMIISYLLKLYRLDVFS
ncbi:DUF2752 domain-containing protein [Sinomicrobium weinanense]|uniref:DUF2752 domain-containing protein n=1 Tax=Sinomicrobium weinanense TaxID=2842200 RepID=A0A926JP26_9FLAO|nr:DUF2752 domain-containing protein [Sinomicrobium weinanense]MBC9794776.1 DUF2752 domain-containing protein [Sinomicrobium weinanense]MBU3125035.1 DUF2752 domain-containing protein [Sinomicrobium weinanense]